MRIGLRFGSVFPIAVGDEFAYDWLCNLLAFIDASSDLDGCILHGYGLNFPRGLDFKRHIFGEVVRAWGHRLAQGVSARRKVLNMVRLIG